MLSLAFSLFGLLSFCLLFYFVMMYCCESIRFGAMKSIDDFYDTKKKNNNEILTNTDDISLKKNNSEMLTKDSTSRFSAFRCRENVNMDDISLEEKRILVSRIKELENRISELENKKNGVEKQ